MLLKHVYLYLNLDEYPDALTTAFSFRTRYLCNFLERRLHRMRFHAEGFSKICVQGCHQPVSDCPIVPDNAVVPTVAFDEPTYAALGPGEEHEYFIAMLTQGLEKCARAHPIPLAELLAGIDEFRRGGYRNEWTHQTKLLRPAGLRASLLCSLDPERFRLTLRLDKQGSTVFEQQILDTKPDEIIFVPDFKEVVLEGGEVVVKRKRGERLFAVSLDSLA